MANEPRSDAQANSTVVVYTKPDCPDCFNAKRYLRRRNVQFRVRDISDRAVVEELLRLLGPGNYATPIIVVGPHVFTGFAANKEHLEHVLTHMGL
jgi:glutaredoxin